MISFARPMVDAAQVGLFSPGIVAPEKVGDYHFRYRLVKIKLEKRSKMSSSGWEVVACRFADDPQLDREKLWGSWLALSSDSLTTDSSNIQPMTKLLLFTKSPFEYARETIDDSYYDEFGETNPTYGISVVTPPQKECFGFDDLPEEYLKEGDEIREMRRGDIIIIGENLHVGGNGDKTYLVVGDSVTGEYSQKSTVIIFPEYIRQLNLRVIDCNCKFICYDGQKKVCEVENKIKANDEYHFIKIPDTLKMDFNILVIQGKARLLRVCYITSEEAIRFISEEENAAASSHAGDAYNFPVENELFMPNTYYRITIATDAERQKGNGGWNVVKHFVDLSYFQTADPPGIFEATDDGAMTPAVDQEHYPNRGPLKDLRPYIASAKGQTEEQLNLIPREGDVAVYRSYDIGAEFNEAYVETMFMLAGKPLSIHVRDTNGQELQVPAGLIAAAGNTWEATEPQFTEFRRADEEWVETAMRAQNWLNEYQAEIVDPWDAENLTDCSRAVAFDMEALKKSQKQYGIWAGGEDFILKPRTMYRASIAAMMPKLVIPLTSGGNLILKNNQPQYCLIAHDGSNFISAMNTTYGEENIGKRIIFDGRNVIQTNYHIEGNPEPIVFNCEQIKNLKLDTLGLGGSTSKPKDVFSWAFTTSRFTSFVHHIQSFEDIVWDLNKTFNGAAWPTPTDQNQQSLFLELKQQIEKKEYDIKEIFESANEYFCLQKNAFPERLEISLLQDELYQYGLLIESPEPLLWDISGKQEGRVCLMIKKANNHIICSEPTIGSIKIIGCSIVDKWVEIILQDDLDLTGYRIETSLSNDQTQISTYYQFGENTSFRVGTIIRINAKNKPQGLDHEVNRRELFDANPLAIFDNAIFRIVTPKNEEVHLKQFLNRVEYKELNNFILIPNTDGTRVFVFFHDNMGNWINHSEDDIFERGSFQFTWTFKCDAGKKFPVLRRLGSKNAEMTSIEFNACT